MDRMKIVIPVVNSPLFLHLQVEGLRTYMPADVTYEVVVFNDAKAFADATNYGNPNMRQRITDTCRELGIRCIPVENAHHQYVPSASHRHADTLRLIMKVARAEGWGPMLMLDSDMFPVVPMGPLLEAYGGAAAGAFVAQSRSVGGGHPLRYLWPNLFFLDMGKADALHLDLLSWDVTPGCDSGGGSQIWLAIQEAASQTEFGDAQAVGTKRLQWIQHRPSCQWGPADLETLPFLAGPLRAFLEGDLRNQGGKFWAELYDGVFLHYRAGSNWNGEGPGIHEPMSELLASSYRRHLALNSLRTENDQNPS